MASSCSLGVLAGTGLYKPRRDKSFLLEIGQLLKASAIIWAMLIVMIYFTSAGPFTRGMLAYRWTSELGPTVPVGTP